VEGVFHPLSGGYGIPPTISALADLTEIMALPQKIK
jgi:hypothetical protein